MLWNDDICGRFLKHINAIEIVHLKKKIESKDTIKQLNKF
jgi:hypothetical protein